MARKFINMYMDNTDMRGYWIVEYVDENGVDRKDRFDNDLDAKDFYNEIIVETYP